MATAGSITRSVNTRFTFSRLCASVDALWGLLHDGSEAFLTDVPRPLKALPEFAAYLEAERRLQAMIAVRFGLDPVQPASVTAADDAMLAIEVRDLMTVPPGERRFLVEPPAGVLSIRRPWSPKVAERRFLRRFEELGGTR